jgi:hypothetical protein
MSYAFWADVIVSIHVLYVGFVVLSQLAIMLGWALKWQWVRNPWFRAAHLLAIGIVAIEGIWDMTCPLTAWEDQLRAWAGQPVAEGSFIGRLMHNLLFYDAPQWIFNYIHIAFGILVLATIFLVPPRWRKPHEPKLCPRLAGQ